MRYAKKVFLVSFVIVLALIIGAAVWLLVLSPYDLPKEPLVFERLKPPSTSTLLDGEGLAIFYFNRQDPVSFYKPLDSIDKKLRDWVVMLEDAKFWSHKGFDVDEIHNSLIKNLEAGKIKRGGSGITQQLAKNLFLDAQRSYTRKLFEVPWTLKIESSLKKRQILELYLNSIEWGPGLAGAEAAARYFFGKSCSNLSPGEAMYLALIIPSPQRFDLIKNPRAAHALETKRRWLVDRLVGEKRLPPSERESYMNMPFGVLPIDAPERGYPAPVGGAFRAPEWASFLKSYAKGRQPKVSILKKVQILGLHDDIWSEENDSGDTPATTWCAVQDSQLVGYWKQSTAVVPSGTMRSKIAEYGFELNPCEDIDVSRRLSL